MDIFSKVTTPTKIVTAMGEKIYEVVGRTVGSRTEQHSVAHVVIPPGKFSRRHYHPEAEESYHVVRGTGWVELDEEIRSLSAGESLLIPAGMPHKIANGSTEDLELMVICVPAWQASNSIWLEDDEPTMRNGRRQKAASPRSA
jgi:mannose-6-phosphate isomerase-like protein (cupin superfamily)